MPARRARSRSDSPARPSSRTAAHAASTIASRAERRRDSRQPTSPVRFTIVRNTCTVYNCCQGNLASWVRCRDHPNPGPLAPCERDRREVGTDRPGRVPRPSPRRLTTTSRIGARRVRPSLQPGETTSRPASRPADPPPGHRFRRLHHHSPRHPGRHHPRVRAGRLITGSPTGLRRAHGCPHNAGAAIRQVGTSPGEGMPPLG
jgi:hypothetical protein